MVFNVTLIHAQSYAKSWHMSVLPDPHQKKSFVKYICRTYSRWQITLIPTVRSSGMTYVNMVSVPVEKHNIYDKYNHLSPSGALTFNTVWTALHTLREHIHAWENDHKTTLGPHALGAWSWLVAWCTRSPYRTIGTVLKQTSSWGDESGIHLTRWEDTYHLTFSLVRRHRIVNCRK
jgi:hypothetical protein